MTAERVSAGSPVAPPDSRLVREAIESMKLPGYQRPDFCALIRASKHTN